MTCRNVQAIAHALTGVTVQLRAPVLKGRPRFTWGDLLNEGLIQPVFLVGLLPWGVWSGHNSMNHNFATLTEPET